MSRKTEILSSLIRNVVGDAILTRISDPRIDPARTSVTRVEARGDLKSAKVFISVAGDDKQVNKTLAALKHAAGYLQDRLVDRTNLKYTPTLIFEYDDAFKKTMETFRLLSEVEEDLRECETPQAGEEQTETPEDV